MDLNELRKLYDFTDRTVVVTGGTGVLGGQLVCALAGCGANVAIVARDPSRADWLRERLQAAAARIIVIPGDVLDAESLHRGAETVEEKFGAIEGLVNAAGGNDPEAATSDVSSFFDLPADAFRRVLDLNVVGTVLPCQAFCRHMAERGGGAILNVSSMSAFRPLTRVPAYSASKAGVSNFTQWLAVHMAQEYSSEIRVNAIAPGFFLTALNRVLLVDESGELTPRGKAIIDHTPMGRLGEPRHLVGAALWLLSPASAFVTGVVVPIDGGFSAYSGV